MSSWKPLTAGLSPRAAILAALAMTIACLSFASSAQAGVGAGATPTYPTVVTVGQTGVPTSIEVRNLNTTPDENNTNTVCNFTDPFPCFIGDPGITHIPSCGGLGAQSVCAVADPGVFALVGPFVGVAGTACAGMTFNITLIDPTFGPVPLHAHRRAARHPAGRELRVPDRVHARRPEGPQRRPEPDSRQPPDGPGRRQLTALKRHHGLRARHVAGHDGPAERPDDHDPGLAGHRDRRRSALRPGDGLEPLQPHRTADGHVQPLRAR